MTDVDRFKQDNLDMIISVGAWPVPCLMMLKRWSEEKAAYEWGQLKYYEKTDNYGWLYLGQTQTVQTVAADPYNLITQKQIVEMIDSGWMVDA